MITPAVTGPALALELFEVQWRGSGQGYGPGMMGWGFSGWFGPIIMVVFWVLAVLGIVYLVKAIVGTRKGGNETAMDIVKKRYAKGEITKEEFEKLREDLKER
jgi:putative membrane protein